MKNKLSTVRAQIAEHNADAALITFLPDIRWSCGFTGSNAILIVGTDDAHFLSDGRYLAQARREVSGAEVHIPGYNLYKHAAEEHLFDGAQTVLFQSEHVTVDRLDDLKKCFPNISWKAAPNLLTEQVASKEPGEVEKIRAAQHVTDSVFEYLCGFIEPGMTERDIAAEIVYQHLKRGAEKMSFEPIVASGPNASLPHARPSNRKLRRGDLVVIDMGCFLDGYASDMTRTVAIGSPGEEARRGYQVVRDAQKRALEAAHAGMTGKELDAVARDVIDEAGLGEYFSHGLGHGLGLQVHEWPRLSHHVEHVLPEGAVVTIEPGLYVPEKYGVRIEDIVVLHRGGHDNLTRSPKDLIEL